MLQIAQKESLKFIITHCLPLKVVIYFKQPACFCFAVLACHLIELEGYFKVNLAFHCTLYEQSAEN